MLSKRCRTHVRQWAVTPVVSILLLTLACGCAGRSIQVDNPVFATAPPRKAMVNAASSAQESKLAGLPAQQSVLPVGFRTAPDEPLEGTTVVAFVNSQPVFLDDVLGGFRQMLEGKSELNAEQRNYILRERLRKQLPAHIEQEILLQALKQKLPEDRRDAIRETLTPIFEEVKTNIKRDRNLQTDQQLNELLAPDGMNIELLQESFFRIQMVNGYLATLASAPKTIDRRELLEYYQTHLDSYTTAERVRCAEIVVRFDQHGGRTGAETVMANVLQQLNSGRDFGDVAEAFSDTLSAEKKGDMGWLERGTLADSDLETTLFSLPENQLTKVIVRPDRFELYKVISHKQQSVVPFQDMQKEIESLLLKEKEDQAKAKIKADLRAKAVVETIFDQA